MSALSPVINRVYRWYSQRLLAGEYQSQQVGGLNERPVEYAFVFSCLAKIYPERILDVGTGQTSLPHMMRTCGFHVSAVDNVTDYWPSGMFNRHYHVIDDDITDSSLIDHFDFVTCVSTLEHIQDSNKAVAHMSRLLKPGGHLLLSFPYNETRYAENVYELPGSNVGAGTFSFVTQAYSRAQIDRWSNDNGLTLIDQKYWRFFTGDYWTVGDRITPPEKTSRTEPHQISCLLLQKTIGGSTNGR